MPNFHILELKINHGEHYFIRREKEGKSKIGAARGYPSDEVIAHFKYHLEDMENKRRQGGRTAPTRMDKIAGSADLIEVNVLATIKGCNPHEANELKRKFVAEYRRKFGARLINER